VDVVLDALNIGRNKSCKF